MELLILLCNARVAGLKLATRSGLLQIEGPNGADAIAEALGARKTEVVSILEVVLALTGATSQSEPAPHPEQPRTANPAVATVKPAAHPAGDDRDEQLREAFEKRAAILVYEGGLSRPEADRQAYYDVFGKPTARTQGVPSKHPWSDELPTWSIDWRQRWGDRANELANAGVPWPDDARLAFDEVAAQREAILG